jgi:hypothetical protein
MFIMFLVFLDIFLVSLELILDYYANSILKNDKHKEEEYNFTIIIIKKLSLFILILLNCEWFMELCVDGLHFFKKFKNIFNFVICVSALVLDVLFHHK